MNHLFNTGSCFVDCGLNPLCYAKCTLSELTLPVARKLAESTLYYTPQIPYYILSSIFGDPNSPDKGILNIAEREFIRWVNPELIKNEDNFRNLLSEELINKRRMCQNADQKFQEELGNCKELLPRELNGFELVSAGASAGLLAYLSYNYLVETVKDAYSCISGKTTKPIILDIEMEDKKINLHSNEYQDRWAAARSMAKNGVFATLFGGMSFLTLSSMHNKISTHAAEDFSIISFDKSTSAWMLSCGLALSCVAIPLLKNAAINKATTFVTEKLISGVKICAQQTQTLARKINEFFFPDPYSLSK